MSRTTVLVLLGIFAVVLVLGYSALFEGLLEAGPREAPDETPAPTTANGEDGEGAGDPEAGEAIYQAQCATCHTTDGSTGVGPTWQGLYGSEVTLESGETVVADDSYIAESILNPNEKVHAGFQPVMPPFSLSDQEIQDIIAFIQTLQ